MAPQRLYIHHGELVVALWYYMYYKLSGQAKCKSLIWNALFCSRCLSILKHLFFFNPDGIIQERFKIHPSWNEIWEAQFSNLLKPHSGQLVDSQINVLVKKWATNQLAEKSVKIVIQLLSWSTSDQPVCQTVSQGSYLITQLVNKWSTSLLNSQSRQLSNSLCWLTSDYTNFVKRSVIIE